MQRCTLPATCAAAFWGHQVFPLWRTPPRRRRWKQSSVSPNKRNENPWFSRFMIRKSMEFYDARRHAIASHVWCTCNMHWNNSFVIQTFSITFLGIHTLGRQSFFFKQLKNIDWFPRVINNILLGSEHIPSLRFQLYTLSFVRFLSSNNSARAIRFGSDEKLRTTSIWKSQTIVKTFISCLFSQTIFDVDVTKCSKVFSLNFNT